MSYITGLEDFQKDALREYLLSDFEAFSKFCFKVQTGQEFIIKDFHKVMFKTIQLLIDHQSNRCCISYAPRFGKTQLVSIFLPLYSWCKSPHGQNILTGFNRDVLAECTGYIRTIMNDADFRCLFPNVEIDMNKKSVEKLGTMSGGVTHSIPTTGSLTGRGCGTLSEEFSGLMVIDDASKPDNAMSPVERNKINIRYSNTLLSRLATEKTPLVLIAQRLHTDDLPGYVMKGGTADVFDWLNVPALLTYHETNKELCTGTQEWYDKQIRDYGYTNVKPILYDLERSLSEYEHVGEGVYESATWPVRKSLKTLQDMRDKDPYTFYSQYMGEPRSKGTETVSHEDLRSYEVLQQQDVAYTFMTADTASTTETYSDYTVACFWAFMNNGDLYLVDLIVNKWTVPDLIVEIRNFWRKHNVFNTRHPNMLPRYFAIEDKASGLFLNQQFLKDGTVTVKEIPRDGTKNNDKFSRFLNAVPYFKQGRIFFPRGHEHEDHIKREIVGQTELGNQTSHDDFVDNVSDAVVVAYSTQAINYADWY